ncbi:hypothetical protein [Stieleria mannarensis]|uniref:hypothetical protein n=1 Tax=Stieleria mannarensis TaxID=2755585 RepID=UPI001602A827|nr:hypothetical protein [Rhodopirellula sp. JC639]
MPKRIQLPRNCVFPLLIGISLAVGWFIPDFYDWTGADQSRPAPVIGWTAFGLLLASVGVWLALPWLPLRPDSRHGDRTGPTQFSLGALVGITAIAAVISAGIMTFPSATSYTVSGLVWAVAVWGWIRGRSPRLPAVTLLACMHLPFAWVAVFNGLPGIGAALAMLAAGLPAFFVTLLAGHFVIGQHIQELTWLSILISTLELALGLWIIRLGPKHAIAYCVLVLLISVYGSFTLNMLVRI